MDNGLEMEIPDLKGEALAQAKLESMNMPRPEDSYNYPIVPGMDEWAALRSGEEMMDICQVPVDILKKMSTQAVIQSIWEHPLLFEILLRYQYQTDFDSFMSNNNAYEELKAREDAGICLLERYTLADPVIPYAEFHEPHVLELIISQTVFLSQLKDNEKKTIVQIAQKNDDLRQKAYPENSVRRTSWRVITWVLMGRTMANAGYVPFVQEVERNEDLQLFLDGSHYTYMMEIVGDSIPEIIIHHIENYTKN
jgi:hypothetical protein